MVPAPDALTDEQELAHIQALKAEVARVQRLYDQAAVAAVQLSEQMGRVEHGDARAASPGLHARQRAVSALLEEITAELTAAKVGYNRAQDVRRDRLVQIEMEANDRRREEKLKARRAAHRAALLPPPAPSLLERAAGVTARAAAFLAKPDPDAAA